MVTKKKVYFLSDTHLGSVSHKKEEEGLHLTASAPSSPKNNLFFEHEIERKLCRWFDSIKHDASAIYMLGDIFDYWFEYKNVVPRGFTRFLGKISELTDMGIEVHFFIGNHDIWVTDYLSSECGMIVHTEPLVREIYGKKFFMAHGDGLGDDSKSFKILRKIFHSKLCRKLFANIHPRWAVGFAHKWSNHSRETGGVIDYQGEDKEHLIQFSKKHLQVAPNINFFIFGHRHILLDLMLSQTARILILGDWITLFSYAVFDGKEMRLELFEQE
ncbi:UDP-2,3-diacylglucosamine diphosphatase [Dysgonomonas sp. 216]|uniref:UDP-2,3-diacylglucosamine diphosphatase n=1 Tax=Dysgonomonas sp. 216 TaxID=2302934 RepID=UPI0013CF8E79|nr:UDP-2,3-diacylglucosamine diphosphatase [Dysgonomonas sp. 216]